MLPAVSAPPPFSAGELARRRAALLQLASTVEVDAVLAYGCNGAGSAVPWLCCWPVTREAAMVLRPGHEPVLLVGFANHVPNARRLARDCQVEPIGDRPDQAVTGRLGGVRRLGTVGPLPRPLWSVLDRQLTLVPLDEDYVALRLRKSTEELRWLRHAAAATDAAAAAVVAAAVPGATELDLVAAAEAAYAGTGASRHIHYLSATAMAEPDRCVPGQWPTARPLAAGSVVLFELSARFGQDYPGQVLRTVLVDAEPTPLYGTLHAVAETILQTITAELRPGVSPISLQCAADLATAAGFTMLDDLVHGLGGGYLPPIVRHRGLPAGRNAAPLEAGMTVVVQPNVCTPDLLAGVQTGEMFEITSDGCRSLHRFSTGLLSGGPG